MMSRNPSASTGDRLPDRQRLQNGRGPLQTHRGDAFGAWLERSLRTLYEPVVDEPVPQELLDLLQPGRPDGSPPHS